MDNILYTNDNHCFSHTLRPLFAKTPLLDAFSYINKLADGVLKVVKAYTTPNENATLFDESQQLYVDCHLLLTDYSGWPMLKLSYAGCKSHKTKSSINRIMLAPYDRPYAIHQKVQPGYGALTNFVYSTNLVGFRKAVSSDKINVFNNDSLRNFVMTSIATRGHERIAVSNFTSMVNGCRSRLYRDMGSFAGVQMQGTPVIKLMKVAMGQMSMSDLTHDDRLVIDSVWKKYVDDYDIKIAEYNTEIEAMLGNEKWLVCMTPDMGMYAKKIDMSVILGKFLNNPSPEFNSEICSEAYNRGTALRKYTDYDDLPRELYTRLAMFHVYIHNNPQHSSYYMSSDPKKFFPAGDNNFPDYGAVTEQDGYQESMMLRWVLL